MKMKEFGSGGGVPGAPLDPSLPKTHWSILASSYI